MTKKEECKALMAKFFGPATANLVENFMTENDCVDKCKRKVGALLGPEFASAFDKIA